MELFLLIACGIAVLSILLAPLSLRISAPILLLFLALGMLLGEEGPGGIVFDDFRLAYQIGTLCLAVILLAGGLDTKLRDLRAAAAPAIVLATFGVALTALAVGVGFCLVFKVSLIEGLLLGSVVASTDAAATFALLSQSGVKLRGRLRETLFVESGLNDPMAIFLTLVFVGLVDSGGGFSAGAFGGSALDLTIQFGLGAAGGAIGGLAAARLTERLHLPAGLHPPFFLTSGLFVFAGVALMGGSGFLAIYLFGIVSRAASRRAIERVVQFHEGLAWLAQIALFIMLGLLVTPSSLGGSVVQGAIAAIILIFLARPAAVALCLAPFRYPVRDQLYVGWVGLKGAVPIFLAIIPVISPGPVTAEFFNAVFIIVIASLLLQGWTLRPAARLLGVIAREPDEPASVAGARAIH